MVYICPNVDCPNDASLQANQECSTCGSLAQDFDRTTLGDLFLAKAENNYELSSSGERKNEFKGVKIFGNTKILMKLDDEKISVYEIRSKFLNESPSEQANRPLFSLPYESITGVRYATSETTSSLGVVIGGGFVVTPKNQELLLVLDYKDELDMTQTIDFRMENVASVYKAVYNKIAKLKRKNGH